MKRVIMTFDDADNPKIEVEGCTGPECAALTADLEKALGSTVGDTKKAEFHVKQKQQSKIRGKA